MRPSNTTEIARPGSVGKTFTRASEAELDALFADFNKDIAPPEQDPRIASDWSGMDRLDLIEAERREASARSWRIANGGEAASGERAAGAGHALGNNTKFVGANSADEAWQAVETEQEKKNAPRRRMWRNQQAAARLLAGTEQKRVSSCMKSVAFGETGVRIEVFDADARARFGGLTLCGNVWTCPCCSRNISRRRADEANKALSWAREKVAVVSPAGKITAERKRAFPMMMTLTARHGRKDDLASLVENLLAAKKAMFQSDRWRALRMSPIWEDVKDEDGEPVLVKRLRTTRMVQSYRKDGTPRRKRDGTPILKREKLSTPEEVWTPKRRCVGYEKDGKVFGMLIAFEITHTANGGWHPHFHIVLFVDTTTEKQARKILSPLRADWLSALKHNNLHAKGEVGFRLDGADKVGDYVAKFGAGTGIELDDQRKVLADARAAEDWGLVQELTAAHAKKSKDPKKGVTPWELLEQYAHEDEAVIEGRKDLGAKKCGALFVEFAKVFHGRQQLQWSQGLKDVVGVDEITDEEAAEGDEEFDGSEARIAAMITASDWYALLKRTDRLQRLGLLELAQLADDETVWGAITKLLGRQPDRSLDEARKMGEAYFDPADAKQRAVNRAREAKARGER